MKIKLVFVGKTKSKYLIEGESEYVKRLKYYCKLSEHTIKEIKNSSKLSKKEFLKMEGEQILKVIHKSDYVILLDDKGDKLSSVEFSDFLNNKINNSFKELVFIVGGAYGFSDNIYSRADGKISMSKMTFSHQIIRLIFKEQLYRAFTIIKGEKYHHE